MSLYDRRAVIGGALALAACQRPAQSEPIAGPLPPLKSLAPFPIGVSVMAAYLDDPAHADLIAAECSQITAEWEMKMEYIVREDGGFRFDRPDKLAAFAQARGMRLFGHTLIWYAQVPPAFAKLDEDRIGFGEAFDNYITAVVGRYRGQAVGWDVVNEAVAEEGGGLRDSLWSQRLGETGYMVRAFQAARAADPDAVLFLNDYNLEQIPAKLDSFQRLVERLLREGAPLTGIGTQTHVAADLPPGALTRTMRELAKFGLPIHLSELDVSMERGMGLLGSRAERRRQQDRIYAEAAEAFSSLPASQRFALTLWGLRDKDSWIVRDFPSDAPALFDDQGRAKAAAHAFVSGLRA